MVNRSRFAVEQDRVFRGRRRDHRERGLFHGERESFAGEPRPVHQNRGQLMENRSQFMVNRSQFMENMTGSWRTEPVHRESPRDHGGSGLLYLPNCCRQHRRHQQADDDHRGARLVLADALGEAGSGIAAEGGAQSTSASGQGGPFQTKYPAATTLMHRLKTFLRPVHRVDVRQPQEAQKGPASECRSRRQ